MGYALIIIRGQRNNMKLTRRQLRKLIREVFATTKRGEQAAKNYERSRAGISPKTIGDLSFMERDGDPETAHDLAYSLGSEEQSPIQDLGVDIPFEVLLSSRKPKILQALGFKNILRTLEFDKKDPIKGYLVKDKLKRAEYKARVLNKRVEDLMEIQYSWWDSYHYMAIEEWLKNNPDLYTKSILDSDYNSIHTLYEVKGVKLLHISSSSVTSTYTL